MADGSRTALQRLILTNHAAERLEQRFGWAGDRQAAEARLGAFPAVRLYLALGGGRCQILLPEADMILGCHDHGILATVMRLSERPAHRAADQSVAFSRGRDTARGRCGARWKRSRRPEQRDQGED